MYRKLMWCYVFILTSLDLSLNSKLTAQGKSHGVTVHDSLVEGITFQEWGSEAGAGAAAGSGRALPPAALRATPPALSLGRASLGAAHAATVTLTNTANTTMHLASIAGTTPDFHASFFDSKTLACGANTSFSVVFLGRREGPVSQHLYIHTSLGVLKYPVSAIGVASDWALWPLVGVRVPHNATLRPLLHMHNPTDQPVQVMEMYSSASWLGLQLPEGGASAPREHWTLPPHSTRALVRLRLRLPGKDTTAYIRIKANVTGAPLVVVVEAAAAAAGAYADPLQLRAGTRGAQDNPYTFSISLGNSASSAPAVAGGAAGGCRAAPHAPPAPPAPPATADAPLLANGHHNGGGGGGGGGGGAAAAEGVRVAVLRAQLAPLQAPERAAHLTLDFAKLWAGGTDGAGADAEAEAGAEERWCAGWAGLAGVALPYSVRLLPGTLRLPADLHFVTADDNCMRAQDIRARNEFQQPVNIVAVEFPPELHQHFETESWAGVSLPAGAEARVARLRLRRRDAGALLESRVDVRTNLTHTAYSVPVQLYGGHLHIEWQWPLADAHAHTLPLGALATSSTRRVAARVRNPAPAPVCATAHAALPGATLALSAEGGCVPARGWAPAVLTVVAPARAGPVRGAVWLQAPAARAETAVSLSALPGAVRARLLHHHHRGGPDGQDCHAAPWASGWAPALVVESTMALRMKLTLVEPQPPDPALVFIPPEDPEAWWIGPGTNTIGHVQYLPELACGSACYTGLAIDKEEWLQTSLEADLELLGKRRALYDTERLRAVRNVSLAIDTTEMVRIPVSGWVRVGWPRLVGGGGGGGGAGWAGLAAVGAPSARWLRLRNPAPHPLAVHATVAGYTAAAALHEDVLLEIEECAHKQCIYVPGVFTATEWRVVRGGAAPLREGDGAAPLREGDGELPALLLGPKAEVELKVDFLPPEAEMYSAVLFLRNNLTIVEAVQLGGRGAVPRFELGGRRAHAHAHAPILLQIPDCEEGQECEAAIGKSEGEGGRWETRRTVLARNTGAVPLRLRAWRLAGAPCAARGFRLEPCAPLTLQPNETSALTLSFTTDCSLARVPCPLTLRSDSGPAAFRLLGAVPARLLPICARQQPRPAWEPALRASGALLAVVALALVLAAAALDAERLLRRARDARQTPAPRAPLDLRALAREQPAVPPPPAAPRRRKPRRTQPPLDPAAERRAFEHWRAEMLRRDAPRAEDESSRSSEDADTPPRPDVEPAQPQPPSEPPPDASDTEPDTEERPRTPSDSDAASGTDSSSPPDDPDEPPAVRAPTPTSTPPPPRSAPPPEPPEPRGAAAARAARRDPGGSPTRRSEPPARPRAVPGKHHTRKDKVSKRRSERPSAAALVSPPRSEVRPAGATAAAAAGAAGAAGGAAPALRWGASWSSVVAAGALPPIGDQVRRSPPAPAPAADQSLFYYNDAHALRAQQPPPRPDAEYAPGWRPQERSPYEAPAPRDYLVPDDSRSTHGTHAYGTIGSPWSSSLWTAGTLRPPPGFGPRAPPPCAPPPPPAPAAAAAAQNAPLPAPPPVRAFDPFHSLASIWAPAAFDWRADPQPRKHN